MADIVETFSRTVAQLIQEALDYAGRGQYDEATDNNIRRIRSLTAVLMAALNAAAVPRPGTPPAPPGA